MAYGTRSLLLDLQSGQVVGERHVDFRQHIEQTNWAIGRVDSQLLTRAQASRQSARFFYDELKATHNPSIQRLSQRVKVYL